MQEKRRLKILTRTVNIKIYSRFVSDQNKSRAK